MDALQTRQAAAITAEFSADMINDFIAFIDRGEKTTQTYLTNLRQFMAWLRYAGVQQPTRADIIAYRDYLLTEHDAIEFAPGTPAGYKYRYDNTGSPYKKTCKPGTVAQYMRNVGQLFKWTAANGIYPDVAANVHAPRIDHSTHRKEALRPADVVQIEQTIDRTTEQGKRLYAMFLLAVTAGLRTIELSRANIRDLETRGGNAFLYVWGKGHTEPDAKKGIAPAVYEALQDYLRSRKDNPTANSPLFVATGNRSGGKRIEARTIGQMLKKAMKEAGYNSERITAHSLRHTAGTAANDLFGLLEAQRYMRHMDPKTTEIYIHDNAGAQEPQQAQDIYTYLHSVEGDPVKEEPRSRVFAKSCIRRVSRATSAK